MALKRNRLLARYFDFSDRCFHWSGLNSVQAREEAAEKLLKYILEYERSNRFYHLLGHSHGGSVIWAMLRQVAASPDLDLNFMRSWVTVGSPFIALRQTFLGRLISGILGWLTLVLLATAILSLALHFVPEGSALTGVTTSHQLLGMPIFGSA